MGHGSELPKVVSISAYMSLGVSQARASACQIPPTLGLNLQALPFSVSRAVNCGLGCQGKRNVLNGSGRNAFLERSERSPTPGRHAPRLASLV